MFGKLSEPISATSRAGVFPGQSTSTTAYGNISQATVPLAVALNDPSFGVTLDNVLKGQAFNLDINGSHGTQNASWIELNQGSPPAPLSPLASGQTMSTQFAAQSNPGIWSTGSGDTTQISGQGNNSSTSGPNGWVSYVEQQIVANGGSENITLPLTVDPCGELNSGYNLDIVGVVTFNITKTSQGPGKGSGNFVFTGTLVNALPLNATYMSQYASFFSQFQGGNSTGTAGTGTAQIRLY